MTKSILDSKMTSWELRDAYWHISSFLPPREKHEARETFDALARSYNILYLTLYDICAKEIGNRPDSELEAIELMSIKMSSTYEKYKGQESG